MTSITSTSFIQFTPSKWEILPSEEVNKLFYEYDKQDQLPEFEDTIMGDKNAKVGILMIHGFSGSNIELTYLGNKLAKQGARVAIPLLPGHGTNYDDLRQTNQQMWYEKVKQSYEFLRNEGPDRKIAVIGHSMGGTLALKLAEEYSNIDAVISMAGPVRYSNFARYGIKLISNMDVNFPYDDLNFEDKRLNGHPVVNYIKENYNKVPLKSLGNLFDLMEDVYTNLDKITAPLCLIYAQNDSVVPSNQVKRISRKVKSDKIEKIWLKNSDHILVIDKDKEIVVNEILNFLDDLGWLIRS